MCPQHRNNMADINSSDQALNGLKIKSDSLPNDWYVTLVNPKTGEPGENMSIARFVELFTQKQPEATESSKGLISASDQANLFKYRRVLSGDFTFNDAIKPGTYLVTNNVAGLPENAYRYGHLIVFETDNKLTQIYIPDTSDSNYIYVRQQWSSTLPNLKWKVITISSISDINNLYSKTANCLTETVTEEVPVSANTPMTLQETGQPVPTTQTVERYEYSVPKMAEAILALQKEIAELKGGAGKE